MREPRITPIPVRAPRRCSLCDEPLVVALVKRTSTKDGRVWDVAERRTAGALTPHVLACGGRLRSVGSDLPAESGADA